MGQNAWQTQKSLSLRFLQAFPFTPRCVSSWALCQGANVARNAQFQLSTLGSSFLFVFVLYIKGVFLEKTLKAFLQFLFLLNGSLTAVPPLVAYMRENWITGMTRDAGKVKTPFTFLLWLAHGYPQAVPCFSVLMKPSELAEQFHPLC